jgi:hypothetical protein
VGVVPVGVVPVGVVPVGVVPVARGCGSVCPVCCVRSRRRLR